MTDNNSQNNSEVNLISSLISITKDLTDIILLENKYLKEKCPKEARGLCSEKNALNASYQNGINALNARGGMACAGKGSEIRELKKATKIFTKVLEKHQTLVKTLKTISENMIKAIGDEVNKQNNLSAIYNSNAQVKVNQSPVFAPLAINQKI